MRNFKGIAIATGIFLAATLAVITLRAQSILGPTNVAAIVCAYNSSTPAPTSGQFYYVQCNSSGQIITNVSTGGPAVISSLADSTIRTGSTGVTSTISGITTGTPSLGRVNCVFFFVVTNGDTIKIYSATFNGVPAGTIAGSPANGGVYIACAVNPSGTTGSLVVTMSASSSVTSDGAVSVTGASGSAPLFNPVENNTGGSGTISVAAGGSIIGYSGAASAGAWTGLTQLMAWNANGDTIAALNNSGSAQDLSIGYSTGAGLTALSFSPVESTTRTKLQNNAMFYISASGSDATGDGSSGNPWATLQYGDNVLSTYYDCAGYNVSFSVGAGTFTGIGLRPVVGCPTVYFVGAGPASTSILAGLADNIYNSGQNICSCYPTGTDYVFDQLTVDGTLTSTVESIGVYQGFVGMGNYRVTGGNVALKFNSSQYFVRLENTGSQYQDSSNLGTMTISGSSPGYVEISGGFASLESNYTIVGSPVWGTAFVQAYDGGGVSGFGSTYTGSATGPSCWIRMNAWIDTGGQGTAHLPGSTPCSGAQITLGGQYN